MKTIIKSLILGFTGIILLGELIGRYYGLNDTPTFIKSDSFEYIHAPNQNRTIYRNKFITNEFSMRSNPITEKDNCTVLVIGDSVVNGGNLTDHDSLATTLLENLLLKKLKKSIRVLNISAGSWGPDNAMAYVKEYGLFNANVIVLVVSSHDSHDNMTHEEIIDKNPQFSSKNYFFAWRKLIERGSQQIKKRILKSKRSNKVKNSNLGISTSKEFNKGFKFFVEISSEYNIPFIIYLHPSLKEFKDSKINIEGQEIIEFCRQNNVNLIQELNTNLEGKFFRDKIHYSELGQKHMAKILLPKLIDLLE